MNRNIGFVFAALTLIACQLAPNAATAASPVAIIDMNYIFKNHPRLEQMRAQFKADFEAVQSQMKQEGEAIRKLQSKLDDFKKGTPEYKALTDELTKRQTDVTVQSRIKDAEFGDRQAKIYFSVYDEIQNEVKYYCEANGISLVVRFNGEKADPNNPKEVQAQIYQDVVYYNQQIDITPFVLKQILSRGAGNAAQQPQQPSRNQLVPGRR